MIDCIYICPTETFIVYIYNYMCYKLKTYTAYIVTMDVFFAHDYRP